MNDPAEQLQTKADWEDLEYPSKPTQTKDVKQIHLGVKADGEPLWHSNDGGKTYWSGSWGNRTPEQLKAEAESVLRGLKYHKFFSSVKKRTVAYHLDKLAGCISMNSISCDCGAVSTFKSLGADRIYFYEKGWRFFKSPKCPECASNLTK